ncbi:Gfo/Idh/MocA family oxidoreductase [soil metagenome]
MFFERGSLSRRGFMQKSVAAMTAAGLPLWYAQELVAADTAANAAAKQGGETNGKLQMGVIGVGPSPRRSNSLYGAAKKFKHVQFTGVCDVDARHVKHAVEQYGKDNYTVKGFKDFREINRSKDIDAVIIAIPDHWHALVAIDALKSGKDVYCEKPLTLTVAEAIALQDAVKKSGKILQTGSQQRDEMGGVFRLAADVVRAGRIGKVKRVECRIGANPKGEPIPEAPVPEGLDWDMWLGPTAKVPYRFTQRKKADGRVGSAETNCHYEFRWWYEYSGGKMTDWGAHHMDIAQWALGMDDNGPVGVERVSADEPYAGKDGYNCHQNFIVKYTYANGTEMITTSGVGGTKIDGMMRADGKMPPKSVAGGENGAAFFGENGTVFVSRGGIWASDAKILSEPLGKDDPMLYPTRPTDHMGNFLDCVKTRQSPICNVTVGGGSVIVCHIGTIALRLGGKYTWDPKARVFTGEGADKANAMLGREYRAPWKLEV